MNLHTLTDFLWPTLEEESQQPEEDTIAWTADSKDAQAAVAELIASEEERLKAIDTKLQG